MWFAFVQFRSGHTTEVPLGPDEARATAALEQARSALEEGASAVQVGARLVASAEELEFIKLFERG